MGTYMGAEEDEADTEDIRIEELANTSDKSRSVKTGIATETEKKQGEEKE